MAEQPNRFEITQEELERIQNAMKNNEFRKMFTEYAKEISDPENRKKYEEEIAQLEAERGMDVKFINPQDGFVVKTSIKGQGGKKAFVNICQSEAIGKATCKFANKKVNAQSVSGQEWSIPYSLNHPKDDSDKAGKKCVVYDVIFNSETYKMGLQNPRFKQLIVNTALDAIEEKWNVKLDRKNLKHPKLKFKGPKQSTIIRIPNNKGTKEPDADIQIGDKKLSYPYKEKLSTVHEPPSKENLSAADNCPPPVTKGPSVNHDVTPKYSIVHRGVVDLQNFTNARDSRASTRPQELVVNIELPLCESSTGIDLDIFEKQLILDSEDPLYHLDISLPYPVKEEEGSAKFDKSKRMLIVTLPVAIVPIVPPCELIKPVEEEPVESKDSAMATDDPSSPVDNNKDAANGHDLAYESSGCSGDDGVLNGVETKSLDELSNISSNKDENEVRSRDGIIDQQVEDKAFGVETLDEVNRVTTGCELNGVDAKIEEDAKCSAPGDLNFQSSKVKTACQFQTSDVSCPFLKTPTYSFHQDSKCVTFILDVPNVSIDTTSLGFNANKCCINFPSSLTSPVTSASPDYALYIQFPQTCHIDSEKSKIDSNENNLVLTLHKKERCSGLWDWFMIGSVEEKLEKKLFLTEGNLQKLLEQSEDLWAEPSSVASHKIENISEDAAVIRLDVRRNDETVSNAMGNILASAEELLSDRVKNVDDSGPEDAVMNVLKTKDALCPNGNLSINDSKELLDVGDCAEDDRDVSDPEHDETGLDYAELEEVEVVEEKYDKDTLEEDHVGLSTVQEADDQEGRKNQAVSGEAEMQRARAMKFKKNRRRRRRSTGSHESSSFSEEEGEPGPGRKHRGKHARRLRKSRSLSLGSSAESHDDADGGVQFNGQRSVRFNLVPEVHVFSNKADKKKWKEIRKQQLLAERDEPGTTADNTSKIKSSFKDSSDSHTSGNALDSNSPEGSLEDVGNRTTSDDVTPSDVPSQHMDKSINSDASNVHDKPKLTNTLMFDLDD